MTRPLSSIIGFTRFSVDPASIVPAGKVQRPLRELQSAVYDPARLTQRFQLFEAFALPGLVAAARRWIGFQHAILVSSNFPVAWKGCLERLISPYQSWLHIKTIRSTDDFSTVVRCAIDELSRGGRNFNFRLDDDDALRPDFVSRILELSRSCDNGEIVSFDEGYYVQRTSGSMFHIHRRIYPKIAIGLGVFNYPGAPDSIFDQGIHGAIAPERVINVTGEPYWIRTCHAYNDSGIRARDCKSVSLKQACDTLAADFPYLLLERALMTLPETDKVIEDTGALRALFHIQ